MNCGEGYTPDKIRSFSPNDLLGLVLKERAPCIREIARTRFPLEAATLNDDPSAPFVLWPAINREPFQPWLPVALGKVAQQDFHLQNLRDHLVVIAAPRSATWYLDPIRTHDLFPGALFPDVLKQVQIQEGGLLRDGTMEIDVPSYVHERDPKTNARGTQTIFFFDPGIYDGKSVIIFDDAIAEGMTLKTLAQFMKERLQAAQVFVAAPMAKQVQNGLATLRSDPNIAGVSVLINVTKTHGKDGPIEFE